ncbi:hypothetical protein LZ30DRAFT_771925 [Colletotrichum cereale]|nr:hypothetical protein LZ30DRAFT_771925 [Colletotrichum cereale]
MYVYYYRSDIAGKRPSASHRLGTQSHRAASHPLIRTNLQTAIDSVLKGSHGGSLYHLPALPSFYNAIVRQTALLIPMVSVGRPPSLPPSQVSRHHSDTCGPSDAGVARLVFSTFPAAVRSPATTARQVANYGRSTSRVAGSVSRNRLHETTARSAWSFTGSVANQGSPIEWFGGYAPR